jgi:hypothetical protein
MLPTALRTAMFERIHQHTGQRPTEPEQQTVGQVLGGVRQIANIGQVVHAGTLEPNPLRLATPRAALLPLSSHLQQLPPRACVRPGRVPLVDRRKAGTAARRSTSWVQPSPNLVPARHRRLGKSCAQLRPHLATT